MHLHIFGCTHKTASVEKRERLAFSPEQTEEALGRLRVHFPGTESVILSTCNRTEIFTACDKPDNSPNKVEIAQFFADFHGLHADKIIDDLFERSGEEAIRHLFMVSASLDSLVVGEAQIIAQFKNAYKIATDYNNAGPISHTAYQRALSVAKRVSTETQINQKRLSIPSVAVCDFAKQIFERFDDKKILVIGAGEMGEETLRYLKDEGAQDVTVLNRSFSRAESIAKHWEAKAIPWEQLKDQLISADLVISTTGATEYIVTAEEFEAVYAARDQKTLCILDLAIPRDFDPKIAEFLQVFLYAIDDLKEACDSNKKLRDLELPKAMAIIEEETMKFMADLNHRATSPIIRRLREDWQKPKDDELKRLFNKLEGLDETQKKEITQSFNRLINKLLHPPLESLRDEAENGIPHGLLDAIKTLFKITD